MKRLLLRFAMLSLITACDDSIYVAVERRDAAPIGTAIDAGLTGGIEAGPDANDIHPPEPPDGGVGD